MSGQGEGAAEREGDTESEAGSRLRAVSTEPDVGLEPTNREIITWAEVRCLTEWMTQEPHDLMVLETEAHIMPHTNSKEPAWDSLSPSFSNLPLLSCKLSLSQKKKKKT